MVWHIPKKVVLTTEEAEPDPAIDIIEVGGDLDEDEVSQSLTNHHSISSFPPEVTPLPWQ